MNLQYPYQCYIVVSVFNVTLLKQVLLSPQSWCMRLQSVPTLYSIDMTNDNSQFRSRHLAVVASCGLEMKKTLNKAFKDHSFIVVLFVCFISYLI